MSPVNKAGVFIHMALHQARPDINAVCHAHGVYGVAWSAFNRPLEMLNQDCCNFLDCQAVVPYKGIVEDAGEGARIAAALSHDKTAAILSNHGLLTVGKTVEEAAYKFLLMEKSCQVQLLAEQAATNGIPKKYISDDDARRNVVLGNDPEALYFDFKTEASRYTI